MKIQDNTGKGYGAKVDNDNRLHTQSVNVPEIASISLETEKSFQVHSERVLVAAATFENILSFQYTGIKKCKINSIMFSHEDVALVPGTGQAMFEVMVNSAYTSGGDLITPVNLNLSSANLSEVTAYSGTTTIVLDTGSQSELMDFSVQNTYNHDFKGALILKKNDHLSILGKSKTIGDIVHAVVFYYEID